MFLEIYVRYNTPHDVELLITTMSDTAANVNVTLPLYDPGYLQTAVAHRNQVVKVRDVT